MKTYTVFCRHASEWSTTFIEAVQAEDEQSAMSAGVRACLDAWNGDTNPPIYEHEDIVCFGLAEGDVKILHWEDDA